MFFRFYHINLVKTDGKWICLIKPNTASKAYYNAFYHHYDAMVYSYFPLSSMLIFNIAIIAKLLVAKVEKKKGNVGNVSLAKMSDSVTSKSYYI